MDDKSVQIVPVSMATTYLALVINEQNPVVFPQSDTNVF